MSVATRLTLLLWLALASLSSAGGCHRSEPPPGAAAPGAEPAAPPAAPEPPAPWPDEEEIDRWLRVEAVKQGAEGGWATGSFDPKRNRIEIDTHDVRRFSIDTSRLSIDWEKLVVLSIDGSSSELRRRKVALLHVERDPRGLWVVVEP